ncbi:protein trichome birefringence-like 1 [Miscanthus floridulus]|uniref:protein trichome birefringence-like 1 n=1 Tax=Miscanthus floridulus TaxID=154761 RepID=UPI003458F4D0
MKGAWKQSGVAAVADHLGGAGLLGRARPVRLCLYGLALTFAGFAVFLAFAPTLPVPPASSPAAAWFDGLIASASPCRTQVSGFLSSLFPANSTSTVPPGGVAARRAGPSGGGFAASGSRGNGSSAARPGGEQLGSGGGVPPSSVGAGEAPSGKEAPVPRDATAAVPSGAPPDDHVQGGAEAKHSAGSAAAEAKGGPHPALPSGGSAQNGTSAKGGVPVRINGSDDTSASSVDAGDGNRIRASARNAAGSTHQLGSGTAALLGNGTAVAFINQTASAVAAAMDSNGRAAAGNNQTVLIQVPAGNKNQSSAASDGSNSSPANKQNESTASPQGSTSPVKDQSARGATPTASNNSAVPMKADANAGRRMKVDWIENMASCDMFYGNWVRDDSYPLYPSGSCPHVDESFNCHLNGRPDKAYERLRWQPSGCRIPRLNPTDMLERLRGKRLVFVGDSLNRNMWESLICILRNSVKDKGKVFEVSGRSQFRAEGSYSFLFQDYNCSVEFFRSPFLVQEWEMPISNGKGTRETLRLDIIDSAFPRYKNADIIIFNTGHWWTHDKTSLGKDYYQEGNRVYSELDVHDAFRRALNTWAKWVDSNVNPKKTTVFFRGYSASHFSGGQWNSGGSCDKETEPIMNDQYLTPYPTKMSILEEVLHGMKTPVVYLNITRMTDYRKEAHPSVYRKQKLTEEERKSPELYQDCSHWCLPGVPDSWNELLYAQILLKQEHTMQQ